MNSAYIWIKELNDSRLIKHKRDEMVSNLKDYKRLVNQYNWKGKTVEDNINEMKESIQIYNEYLNK